jgi:hypothetical protein
MTVTQELAIIHVYSLNITLPLLTGKHKRFQGLLSISRPEIQNFLDAPPDKSTVKYHDKIFGENLKIKQKTLGRVQTLLYLCTQL